MYTSAGVTAGMDLADAVPVVEKESATIRRCMRPGISSCSSADRGGSRSSRRHRAPGGRPAAAPRPTVVAGGQSGGGPLRRGPRRRQGPHEYAELARGHSPMKLGPPHARYVERVRVEAARRRLEESDDGIDQCGDVVRIRQRQLDAAIFPQSDQGAAGRL